MLLFLLIIYKELLIIKLFQYNWKYKAKSKQIWKLVKSSLLVPTSRGFYVFITYIFILFPIFFNFLFILIVVHTYLLVQTSRQEVRSQPISVLIILLFQFDWNSFISVEYWNWIYLKISVNFKYIKIIN